jgi:hypothetical protein
MGPGFVYAPYLPLIQTATIGSVTPSLCGFGMYAKAKTKTATS